MLSILIPTYNYSIVALTKRLSDEAKTLEFTIEIIVFDDGSTHFLDENRSVVEIAFVTYIFHEKNVGRTAARHFLAEKAQYNELLFLDADVMPVYTNFIARYRDAIGKNTVAFGGITYRKERPSDTEVLRWKYGHAREKQSVAARRKKPYTALTTGCFMIDSALFLSISESIQLKVYGMDLVLKQRLEERNVTVDHIDNPVYHLGLEPNNVFLHKALDAVKTTVLLEDKGWLPKDSRNIQKHYLKLRKWKVVSLFRLFFNPIRHMVKRNLISKNPSLFWFDLYRLDYYIELKRKQHV